MKLPDRQGPSSESKDESRALGEAPYCRIRKSWFGMWSGVGWPRAEGAEGRPPCRDVYRMV